VEGEGEKKRAIWGRGRAKRGRTQGGGKRETNTPTRRNIGRIFRGTNKRKGGGEEKGKGEREEKSCTWGQKKNLGEDNKRNDGKNPTNHPKGVRKKRWKIYTFRMRDELYSRQKGIRKAGFGKTKNGVLKEIKEKKIGRRLLWESRST